MTNVTAVRFTLLVLRLYTNEEYLEEEFKLCQTKTFTLVEVENTFIDDEVCTFFSIPGGDRFCFFYKQNFRNYVEKNLLCYTSNVHAVTISTKKCI